MPASSNRAGAQSNDHSQRATTSGKSSQTTRHNLPASPRRSSVADLRICLHHTARRSRPSTQQSRHPEQTQIPVVQSATTTPSPRKPDRPNSRALRLHVAANRSGSQLSDDLPRNSSAAIRPDAVHFQHDQDRLTVPAHDLARRAGGYSAH